MAQDPSPQPPSHDTSPEPQIDSVFRNGSMTVVGVLAAFSLGILQQWTDDPTPWHWADIVAVVPMGVGIVMQLRSLKWLLQPDSLIQANYRRAIRQFLWGLALVSSGVMVGAVQDAFTSI